MEQFRNDVALSGVPVEYVDEALTSADAWARLSPTMREWAQFNAGDPIRDPHTGVPTVYWSCSVYPERGTGPNGATVTANYELVLFGRRGLVVSSGSSAAYVDAPDATGWRHQRYAIAVDAATIRSDHRTGIGPPPSPACAAGEVAGPPGTPGLLRLHVAERFGNLPVMTQRFLVTPFRGSAASPRADVRCTVDTVGAECVETYWVYLFTAMQVAFAHAVRRVPYRSGLTGPALGNGSPERAALTYAPWAVSAWVASAAGSAVALPSG